MASTAAWPPGLPIPGGWALKPTQNQVLTDLFFSSSSSDCLISSVPSLCLIYDLWGGTQAARSGWDWCESPEWSLGQQALQIAQKQHHSCLGATQAFLRVPTSAPSPQTGAHAGCKSQVVIWRLKKSSKKKKVAFQKYTIADCYQLLSVKQRLLNT